MANKSESKSKSDKSAKSKSESKNSSSMTKALQEDIEKHTQLDEFLEFIREQGVIGLAIAFILGAAVTKVVNSLVSDLIDPFISLFLGATGNIQDATFEINGITFAYGNFLSVLLDFVVIAAVVFFIFKGMKFEKLDKKKG